MPTNIINMTTYNKIIIKPEPKYSIANIPSRNLNIKHRNYSSSKLLKNIKEASLERQKTTFESESKVQSSQLISENNEMKKYCMNRFRLIESRKAHETIRRNSSLKVFKKDSLLKVVNVSKIDLSKKEDFVSSNRDERNSKESELGRTISIKRRIELINKNHNKLRLNSKESHSQKESIAKHEVSFDEGMEKCIENEQKLNVPKKIWSENVLGEGLKKCSSTKIKILVKNPFERHMKHQQELKEQQIQQIKETQMEGMKENEEIPKVDESFASNAYKYQLQELLALI